ncbi:MAG: DUF1836 domain-containing protein [Lachnospiraceae bacterium]|nr:DUF1836 domain-containing protein [Lachnospiraceae bacterium]
MDIEKILDELTADIDIIDSNDIPNIDLYMDQVTTFMDHHLSHYKRTDDEKILTKTMINNYAKSSLLPSPEKKKYSKDHMILLILIYYFKNILSINDIKKLTDPISNNYFGNKESLTITDIYDFMNSYAPTVIDDVKGDVLTKLDKVNSSELFRKIPESEDSQLREEELRNFLTILALTFDITIKKQLIENIIDSMVSPADSDLAEEKKSKDSKEKNKNKE